MWTKRKSNLDWGITAGKDVYEAELQNKLVEKLRFQWPKGCDLIYISASNSHKEVWAMFDIKELLALAEELKGLVE